MPKQRNRAVLNVHHLRVVRGDTVILDDVSWRVDHGQHWVILGANGCPTEGTIYQSE
jgi:iron complex transport system ATP-binding protein